MNSPCPPAWNQLRIHVTKHIRNIQHMDPLVLQQARVLRLQPLQVLSLHHKDDVGPAATGGTNRLASIRTGARRTSTETGPPTPHGLSGGTAPLVAAANEKKIGHCLSGRRMNVADAKTSSIWPLDIMAPALRHYGLLKSCSRKGTASWKARPSSRQPACCLPRSN